MAGSPIGFGFDARCFERQLSRTARPERVFVNFPLPAGGLLIRRFPKALLCVITLAACDSMLDVEQIVERGMVLNAGPAELPPPSGKSEQLESALFSNDAALGQPYMIRIVGSSVLVADAAKGPPLHIFDMRDGHRVASVSQNGDGPGDFRGLWGMALSADSRSVYLYDFNSHRISQADQHLLSLGQLIVERTTRLKARASSIFQLGDGTWFATNASGSSLYQRFDSTLGTMTDLKVQSFAIAGRDSVALQSAYEARACGMRGNQIAVAFRYTARVTIVDVAAGHEVSARTPVVVEPNFIDNPLAAVESS